MDRDLVDATRREFERRGVRSHRQGAVALEFERLNRLVQGVASKHLSGSGLTYAGWQALVALSFSHDKALATAQLAARVGSHPTTLTRTVDRLERDGFVRRAPMAGDRRVTIVEILPAGEDVQDQVMRALDESQFGMAHLSDEALENLIALLREARTAMNEAVEGSPRP